MAQHSRPDMEHPSASSSQGAASLATVSSVSHISANGSINTGVSLPIPQVVSSTTESSSSNNKHQNENNLAIHLNSQQKRKLERDQINVSKSSIDNLCYDSIHCHQPEQQQQQQQQQQQDQHHHRDKPIQVKNRNITSNKKENRPINGQTKDSTCADKLQKIANSDISGLQQQLSREPTTKQRQTPLATSKIKQNNSIEEKNKINTTTNNANLDGRRTLIKNQLYLIEQLQLENASLRNERDQLQLENEELKFQLQMINSSNILSSDSTSNSLHQRHHHHHHNHQNHLQRNQHDHDHHDIDQQTLATACFARDEQQQQFCRIASSLPHAGNSSPVIVDHDRLTATNIISINNKQLMTTTTSNFNNSKQNQQHQWHHSTREATSGQQHSFYTRTGSGSSSGSSSSSVTTSHSGSLIHATPLRRPVPPRAAVVTNDNKQGATNQLLNYDLQRYQNHQSQQQRDAVIYSENLKKSRLHSASPTNYATNEQTTAANLGSCGLITAKQLNVVNSAPGGSSGLTDEDEENERVQMRLVEQRFGDDRDQLRFAAVIIQRAFRRYQICKRFRTITEQLRRSTEGSLKQQQQQQTQPLRSTGTTTNNESLIESLSQAAHQLIANTKAAVISATIDNNVEQQHHQAAFPAANFINNSSPFRAIRKAFSSQQVNQLGNSNTTTPLTTAAGSNLANTINNNRGQILSIHHVEAHRALLYRVGLNIFNRTPEKGISYFIAHNFIENGPQSINGSYYVSNRGAAAHHNNPSANMINNYKQQSLSNNSFNCFNQNSIKAGGLNCNDCLSEENIKRNVADFLATRRGLSREKIGHYLGNLQEKFNQEVLLHYLQAMDFCGLQVDVGLRKFLSGFRLPGEAQKIERLVEVFASRYVQSQAEHQQQQQHDNGMVKLGDNIIESNTTNKPLTTTITTSTVNDIDNINLKVPLLNKDEIFILSFAIIMLNTDLHSPSLKPQSRMSAQQFVNNLRGLFKSQPVQEGELIGIYNRIKANQISTLPDHMVNLVHVQARLTVTNFQRKEMIPNLCQPHRRMVCYCRVFEVYDPQKKERGGQHQREIYLFNDMILICKIAKRTRANTEPPLVYRNSFPLLGLGVELFQSAHYDFGIRLYQVSTNTTLIMFNSVNKQDQIKFTRDLQDSIAEIHEMEEIKNKNIIDLLHLNFMEKLRKHSIMHQQQEQHLIAILENKQDNQVESLVDSKIIDKQLSSNNHLGMIKYATEPPLSSRSMTDLRESSIVVSENNHHQKIATCSNDNQNCNHATSGASMASLVDQPRSTSSSGSSSNGSTTCNHKPSKITISNPQNQTKSMLPTATTSQTASGVRRKCSASSVFSHDSGLFAMSRDVSPNQSS